MKLLSFMCIASVAALATSVWAEEPVADFVEETASSGIASTFTGDWEYMVGGGTAIFDCNDDGYPDAYLAGGTSKAAFFRNVSKHGGPLQFQSVASGLDIDSVLGAYPINIDGDAHVDLVVLRQGENIVMRGQGDCRFVRANEEWGFDGGDAWTAAMAATWEKGQDWPTIAIGNYIDRKEEISPWGSCTDNWLHRPDADEPRSFARPFPLTPSYCPLSLLFSDWNRSGIPALRMTNDRQYYEGGREQLWHVDPGKTPELYQEEEGWKYLRIWGMGIAGYDLDYDGYPEYALTSMADNKLQVLAEIPATGQPRPSYKDVAYPKGVTAHRPYTGGDLKPSTAWHIQFEDVNNDGRADLFIAKGNVAEMPDFAMRDPNNLLLQTSTGKFLESGDKAGVASMESSRGGALADFNLDGLVDLLVVNRGSKAQVWRNVSDTMGHWVAFKLQQDGGNRDSIGAWLQVRRDGKTMSREITIGGGHASGQLTWWHMGLGTASTAEFRVIWPDGAAGEWQSLPANQFYVVERGKAVRVFTPKN